VQSIGFRLADAVPLVLIEMWKQQLHVDRHTPATDPRMIGLRRKIDRYEDVGHGSCVLRNPRAAAIVEAALLYFDRERYSVIAWCVMPNHVHVMIEPYEGFTLPIILHSWKSYTAKEINKLLRKRGQFWLEEYHDRYIRNERHFHTMVSYIENNPVKAGLCREAAQWAHSSARFSARGDGGRDARAPR
jgi:REP element-mobilizing transposase RayT